MSPWTDLKAIDLVVDQVMEAREQIACSWSGSQGFTGPDFVPKDDAVVFFNGFNVLFTLKSKSFIVSVQISGNQSQFFLFNL
jgi:hypothetical protein